MQSLGPPTSAAPLRRLVAELGCREASDADVLSRFLASGDETSFGTLVRRHGPMVLGVCRCVLRSDADAEDAFQAVFLTLATKAAYLREAASLAGWLYGVAYRTALKARVAAARRRAREARAECRRAEAPPDLPSAEAQEAVHDSLLALPDRYRLPLVLCYLEGRTQDEAARSLGLSRAGLKKRLEGGRDRLREGLVRRGMGPAAALLAAAWPGPTSAALPAALARSTTLAGTLLAAGKGTAVSACVLALVEGGSRVAFPIALKIAAAFALVLGTACFAVYQATEKPAKPPTAARPALAAPPAAPPTDRHGDPLPMHAVARLGTVRFRSDDWVSQAAVVPGGKQLLGLGASGVILWDAATGREVRRFAGSSMRKGERGTSYSVRIESFAVSPDGKTLAAGTSDGTKFECPILLFDLATGRKLGEWSGHGGNGYSANNSLAFVTPSLLVSAGADGTARVWDVPAKREARRLATPDKGPIGQLVRSPDGKTVFGAGSDGKSGYWTAWEVATGKVTHREADLPGNSVKLALSPDGTAVAVAVGVKPAAEEAGYTEVRVYSALGWKVRRRWRAHEGKVPWRCSVAFAPDGKTVATGGADQQVRRWDVGTGKEIGPAIRPYVYANAGAYLDADTLLTFDAQNAIKFWNPTTGEPKLEFAGSESHLTALAYSPDGRHVAAGGGGGDATIRVWEASTGKLAAHLKGGMADITCVRFSPNGKQVVSADSGGAARLWDWAKQGDPVRTFAGHKPWLHAVAFTPDGKRLATGDEAGVVRVWDASSGKKDHQFEGHTAQISALAYAPDGRTLFSGGWDHSIRQWDQTTGKVVRVIKGTNDPANRLKPPVGHTSVVTSLAVSPGGRWMYSGSYDHTICVWETATGRLCRILKGSERDRNSSVNAIALSPDGTRLAAAIGEEGQDSSVHLWDVLSGKKVGALPGHRGAVTQLAFSPDGRRLASASADTTVLIWDTARPPRREEEMDAKTAAKLWDDLASDDPAVSYDAVCRSVATGAVAGLKAKLGPTVAVDAGKVAEWVRRLDSDVFVERQQASQALSDLGPGAEAALLAALAKAKSAEVKKRLGRFLRACATDRRRPGHAIEALEMIGTPEAKRHLTTLAGGASGAWVTREAAAAIARLRKRP